MDSRLPTKNMIERYRTMKNSLFKRAIAIASTVPVALTQCLSVASAVAVENTVPAAVKSEGQTFTLDRGDETSLLYIAPEDDYAREGDKFTKVSSWNSKVNAALIQSAGKTGVLDLENVYAQKANAEELVQKPFAQEEELRAATTRLNELNVLLNNDKDEPDNIKTDIASSEEEKQSLDDVISAAKDRVSPPEPDYQYDHDRHI